MKKDDEGAIKSRARKSRRRSTCKFNRAEVERWIADQGETLRPKREGGAAGSPDTATWEAFAVFRETFLANLPEDDATALRQVGRRMYLDRMEAFRLEDGKGEDSPTCADLRAAAADLAVMAGFFSSVGAWADLPPKEAALARLARDCATLLTDLEGRLVAALGSDSQKEDLDGELAN